jgi:hypothetical protein
MFSFIEMVALGFDPFNHKFEIFVFKYVFLLNMDLLRFCKWGSKLSGLDCGENSIVKCA